MIPRRGFLGGLSAFAALGIRMDDAFAVSSSEIDGFGALRLSFGAFSDLHVASPAELPKVEKALRYFDSRNADAVLCSGDIADFGLAQQLKLVGELWKKVFPDGRGSDGRPVVNLMHYGDHDLSVSYANHPMAKKQWPDDVARRAGLIYTGDRGAIWKDAFGQDEPWAALVLKTVKGYPFVLSHFTRGEPGNRTGDNVPGLEEFLRQKAGEFDPKKPLFYSQHRIPRLTAGGKEVYGQDDGTVGRILSQYPNAVAFCGHCHLCAANERAIWQGAFTCIQVPGHRYCCSEEIGVENGYASADKWQKGPVKTMRACPGNSAGQLLFCRVYDRALVIERLEVSGKSVNHMGDDWVVPFSSFDLPAAKRPFNHDRRAQTLPPSVFPGNAKVTVDCVKDKDRANVLCEFFRVSFRAAAKCGDNPRGHKYAVLMQTRKDGAVCDAMTRLVYPNLYYYGDAADRRDVSAYFRRSEVEDGLEHRFLATPLNGMGRAGGTIVSEWGRFNWKKESK